jgi:hypothetical protein
MKPNMRRWLAATAVAAMMFGAGLAWDKFDPAARLQAFTLTELGKLTWYGPVGITRGQTALFNYTNFAAEGTLPVHVEWAFSDALTGELIVGNFGKPRTVAAMKGLDWYLSGDEALAGRDQKRRHVVGWLMVTYDNKKARSQGVDLANIEVLSSETMATQVVVHANPIAPGDLYAQLKRGQ